MSLLSLRMNSVQVTGEPNYRTIINLYFLLWSKITAFRNGILSDSCDWRKLLHGTSSVRTNFRHFFKCKGAYLGNGTYEDFQMLNCRINGVLQKIIKHIFTSPFRLINHHRRLKLIVTCCTNWLKANMFYINSMKSGYKKTVIIVRKA